MRHVLLLVVHFLGSHPLRVGGLDRLPDASHEGEGQEGRTEHETGHQGNLGQAFERSDEPSHRGASSLQHALDGGVVSDVVVDELVVDSVRVQAPSLIALLDEFFGLKERNKKKGMCGKKGKKGGKGGEGRGHSPYQSRLQQEWFGCFPWLNGESCL